MFLEPHRAAEGWYPDPGGRMLMRRWTGAEWAFETQGDDAWADPPLDAQPLSQSLAPEEGWASVAFALHSAIHSGKPVAVTVALSPASHFTVDTLNQVYSWDDEPEVLPILSGATSISFAPGPFETTSTVRSLDGLLWRISMTAFANRTAPWLREDDLYRMQRWPNLTTINPELDDMRQAAMLANGMFTVDELAGFSDRSITATRALINALSLMNTLKVATPRDTGIVMPQQTSFGYAQQPFQAQSVSTQSLSPHSMSPQSVSAPRPPHMPQAQRPGLFQRLRSRLGL